MMFVDGLQSIVSGFRDGFKQVIEVFFFRGEVYTN